MHYTRESGSSQEAQEGEEAGEGFQGIAALFQGAVYRSAPEAGQGMLGEPFLEHPEQQMVPQPPKDTLLDADLFRSFSMPVLASQRPGAASAEQSPCSMATLPGAGPEVGAHGGGGLEEEQSSMSAQQQQRSRTQNKAAQKRYRDRQKTKMQDMERQLGEQAALLAQMADEKAHAEAQLALLQQASYCPNQPGLQQMLPLFEGTPGLALPDAEEEYRRAAAEWHRALHADDRPLVEEQLQPSQWEPVLILQQHITFAGELMVCLRTGAGSNPASASHQRMEQLVEGHRRMAYHLASQDPRLFWRLTSELKKHTAAGAARGEVARRCLAAMALMPQQRQRMLELRRSMFQRMRQILQGRRQMLLHLQASVPSAERVALFNSMEHHGPFGQALTASEEIQQNVEAEQRELWLFSSILLRKEIFCNLQFARCVAEAFPYMHDTFAIVDVIAVEEGEETQQGFLAALAAGDPQGSSLMQASSGFPTASS